MKPSPPGYLISSLRNVSNMRHVINRENEDYEATMGYSESFYGYFVALRNKESEHLSTYFFISMERATEFLDEFFECEKQFTMM